MTSLGDIVQMQTWVAGFKCTVGCVISRGHVYRNEQTWEQMKRSR